jgi:hypothetical protein
MEIDPNWTVHRMNPASLGSKVIQSSIGRKSMSTEKFRISDALMCTYKLMQKFPFLVLGMIKPEYR